MYSKAIDFCRLHEMLLVQSLLITPFLFSFLFRLQFMRLGQDMKLEPAMKVT